MTPEKLAEHVLAAAQTAFATLDLDASALPAATTVERPRQPEHGDYASTLCLQLAKKVGRPPRELAEAVSVELAKVDGVAAVEIAGPGFLNIRLDAGATGSIAGAVVAAGDGYGRGDAFAGQKWNLEFVSANPTGPVHIGGVRWAAVGDALGRILKFAGADVTTEYYFNDAGAQIDHFSASLLAAAKGEPTPENGYKGAYIQELADTIVEANPDALSKDDPQEFFRVEGITLMFAEVKKSLAEFGTHFDVYFNERDLHVRGDLDKALARLREQGNVYEKDGAVWLRSSDYGDDKDRVLVRGNGSWTYFAADCAYYLDKRERGFDKVVIMLGADHHGYIGRMKAMVACFGDDPGQTLEILIGQMVNLLKDGEPVKLSKRAGTIIGIDDVVDAIGVDATRYALARYSSDSTIDLDLDLWARQSSDNPVFYVQYAHARINQLLGNAADLGATLGDGYDASLLSHPREGDLLKAIGEFPAVVVTAAELREPHRIARYLEDLAGAYHRFYDACRVLPRGDEEFTETGRARLWLMSATKVVLANGLRLLGVSAPERM